MPQQYQALLSRKLHNRNCRSAHHHRLEVIVKLSKILQICGVGVHGGQPYIALIRTLNKGLIKEVTLNS